MQESLWRRSQQAHKHTAGRGRTPRKSSLLYSWTNPKILGYQKRGKEKSKSSLIYNLSTDEHLERGRVLCLSRQINLSATDRRSQSTSGHRDKWTHGQPTDGRGVQRAVFARQSVATAVTTLKHTQHTTVLKHNFQKLKHNPCTHKLTREPPRWGGSSEGLEKL